MRCGCTIQYPCCARGEELFTALVQSHHRLNTASREDREEQWDAFYQARIAYLDHMQGRRQGDLSVRYQGGTWLVEQRHQEQWPLQFSTTNDAELQIWLKQSFWRYAQLDGDEYRDRLTGYYHRRPSPAHPSDSSAEQTRPLARLVVGQQKGDALPYPQVATDPSKEVERPMLELRTQVALVIAVQVGHAPQPLTPLDYLSLQRKAVDVLLSSNVQRIEAEDLTWIQIVIDEAVRLRETLGNAESTTFPQG